MDYNEIDELVALLRGPDTDAAVTAATELGKLGGAGACHALAKSLLNPGRTAVRVACADALGVVATETAARALIQSLNVTDRLVWRAAAEALASFEDEAMPAVVALLQAAEPASRTAALQALLWLTVEYDDPEASVSDFDFLAGWGWWN